MREVYEMEHEQDAAKAPSATSTQPARRESVGTEGQPTWNSPSERPLTPIDVVRFDALRSAYGHEDRAAFFALWHRLVMFFVTISGTAAFAALAANSSWPPPQAIALLITCLGLLDLVFDLSGQARAHAEMRRRFLDLYADAQADGAPASELNVKLHKLYGEEPLLGSAVDAIAYNRAMRSLDRPPEHMLVIPRCHRTLRHVVARTSSDYKSIVPLAMTPPSS